MRVNSIEIKGLECVVSHVTRNYYEESKWYQHIGKAIIEVSYKSLLNFRQSCTRLLIKWFLIKENK